MSTAHYTVAAAQKRPKVFHRDDGPCKADSELTSPRFPRRRATAADLKTARPCLNCWRPGKVAPPVGWAGERAGS
jgi:hypothetical protein